MKVSAMIPEDQFADSVGHWYERDGSPAYRIIGANGKERATTLRDARKMNLVPSVTTILQMEAKPQLTRWLVEQGMMACLTLPRMPDETDTDFMARALKDSKEQAKKAAERGSWLHGLIEDSMRQGQLTSRCPPEDEPFITPVLNWIYEHFPNHTWSPERSFATDQYGGKMDLYGQGEYPVLIDYKTKAFTDPTKKLAYDEHCTQLAAYAMGVGSKPEEAHCVNLFISTVQPNLIVPKHWEPSELISGWKAFTCLLGLWRARKGYG